MPALVSITAACASSSSPPPPQVIRLPAEVRTEFVYARPPADALMCLDEVIAPESLAMEGALDRDAAAFEDENRRAGADCRAKIQYLKGWADSLPK